MKKLVLILTILVIAPALISSNRPTTARVDWETSSNQARTELEKTAKKITELDNQFKIPEILEKTFKLYTDVEEEAAKSDHLLEKSRSEIAKAMNSMLVTRSPQTLARQELLTVVRSIQEKIQLASQMLTNQRQAMESVNQKAASTLESYQRLQKIHTDLRSFVDTQRSVFDTHMMRISHPTRGVMPAAQRELQKMIKSLRTQLQESEIAVQGQETEYKKLNKQLKKQLKEYEELKSSHQELQLILEYQQKSLASAIEKSMLPHDLEVH